MSSRTSSGVAVAVERGGGVHRAGARRTAPGSAPHAVGHGGQHRRAGSGVAGGSGCEPLAQVVDRGRSRTARTPTWSCVSRGVGVGRPAAGVDRDHVELALDRRAGAAVAALAAPAPRPSRPSVKQKPDGQLEVVARACASWWRRASPSRWISSGSSTISSSGRRLEAVAVVAVGEHLGGASSGHAAEGIGWCSQPGRTGSGRSVGASAVPSMTNASISLRPSDRASGHSSAWTAVVP